MWILKDRWRLLNKFIMKKSPGLFRADILILKVFLSCSSCNFTNPPANLNTPDLLTGGWLLHLLKYLPYCFLKLFKSRGLKEASQSLGIIYPSSPKLLFNMILQTIYQNKSLPGWINAFLQTRRSSFFSQNEK